MNQVGAIDTVHRWIKAREPEFANRGVHVEYKETKAGVGAIWLYCPKYLIDICIWDHAFCLDILALKKDQEGLAFSEAGSCESIEGIMNRLDRFWRWFESEHPVGVKL